MLNFVDYYMQPKDDKFIYINILWYINTYLYNICWIQNTILIILLLLKTNKPTEHFYLLSFIMSDFSSISIIFKCYLYNVCYVPYSMCFWILFFKNWVNIFHMNDSDKTLYKQYMHIYFYVCNIKTNMLLINFKCWYLSVTKSSFHIVCNWC